MSEVTDDFLNSAKDLFAKRKAYRVAATLLGVSMFLAPRHDAAGSIMGVILFLSLLFVGLKLMFIQLALKNYIWQKFQNSLTSTQRDSVKYEKLPLKPKSVISNLGGSLDFNVLAQGSLNDYDVRLLELHVTFNPQSKNGRYDREFRVFEVKTNQSYYHVFMDSKSNSLLPSSSAMSILSRSLSKNKTLTVEGDVERYFKIYVPEDSGYESLITLSPDKLISLRNHGTRFDIEFIDDVIYIITSNKIKNLKDVMLYQKSLLDVVSELGLNLQRMYQGEAKELNLITPTVITFL